MADNIHKLLVKAVKANKTTIGLPIKKPVIRGKLTKKVIEPQLRQCERSE